MISIELGTIVAVSLRTAGTQLVGDHAIGVTELLVDDCYDLIKPAGSLTIGDETLTYSRVDDELSTVYLDAATTVAYDDLTPIGALPAAPVKVATVRYPGAGEGVPARLLHVLDSLLPEGVRDPVDQEDILLLVDDHGLPVVLDVLGRESTIDPAKIAYPTVTNLCTDPKPTNYEHWVGGPGNGGGGFLQPSIAASSTYADRGLHMSYNPGALAGVISFSPDSTGPTVVFSSPSTGYMGNPHAIPFHQDISFSVHTFAPEFTMTVGLSAFVFDASLTWLDAGTLAMPTVTVAKGSYANLTGTLDYTAITDAFPTAVWAVVLFTPDTADGVDGEHAYFGSCMYATSSTPTPYRDGTSAGWVDNGDGTSSGRIDLDTAVSWWDLFDRPESFIPTPHTHAIADVIGLQADLDSKVETVVPGDGILVDSADPLNPVVSLAPATSALLPLTTVVGGVPDLVWDANNELVYTEVPL